MSETNEKTMSETNEKLMASFDRLQGIQIQATIPNMEKLLQTLYDLRDIYNGLNKEGDDGGRKTDTPE